jgi:hypothetical protein
MLDEIGKTRLMRGAQRLENEGYNNKQTKMNV